MDVYFENLKQRKRESLDGAGPEHSGLEEEKRFSVLGRLAGNVAHEINSPLDGVIRYVNLALESVQEDSAAREYLLQARQGLTRIAGTVRSLLDFCWSFSPCTGKTDVNREIEESLQLCSYHLHGAQVVVEKYLDSALPELPNYKLKPVFTNIVRNACEAMDAGGTLRVYSARNNGTIEVRFKDTGKGIPEGYREKIFEPFFTTKNLGHGSGLGLAIAHQILERYNGSIAVESTCSEGTTFIIRVPVESGPYAQDSSKADKGPAEVMVKKPYRGG